MNTRKKFLLESVPLILVLLAGARFLRPGLGGWFFNDDFHLIHRLSFQPFLDILSGDYPEALYGPRENPYWRPGWYLLLKIVHRMSGIHASGYLIVVLGMHLTLSAMLYGMLRRTFSVRPLAASAATLLFFTAPAPLEGVFWICAGFNVLPAAGTLLLAAHLILVHARTGRSAPYLLALCACAVSLTFKEAAYMVPLLVLAAPGATLAGGRAFSLFRRLMTASPFIVLVGIHFLFLNRFTPRDEGFVDLAVRTLTNIAKGIEALIHLDGPDPLVLVAALIVMAVLFRFSDGKGRYLACWFAASFLPFAFEAFAPRFTYFVHLPMVLLAGYWMHRLAPRGEGRGARTRGILSILVLTAALGLPGAIRIPGALDDLNGEGRHCRAILESLREHLPEDEDVLIVDAVPPRLQNGFADMIHLFTGKRFKLRNLLLYPYPPSFLIHGDPDFGDLDADRIVFRYISRGGNEASPDSPVYRPMPLRRLIEGRILLPLVDFRAEYRVLPVEDHLESLLAGAVDPDRTVLLDAPPEPPPAPSSRETAIVKGLRANRLDGLTLELECRETSLLLVCPPIPGRLKYRLDGEMTVPLRANGVFYALPLHRGVHLLIIRP